MNGKLVHVREVHKERFKWFKKVAYHYKDKKISMFLLKRQIIMLASDFVWNRLTRYNREMDK